MIASALKPGFIRLTCIFLFTAILGGCGFHLKNSNHIPNELRNITLVSSKYSDLTRLIKKELRYNQINLVVPAPVAKDESEAEEADPLAGVTQDESSVTKIIEMDPALLNSETPVLRIMSESTSKRTVSLYSDATAAEYELSYVIIMEVRLPNQDPQHFTIAVQRDQLTNSQEALARSRESELLRSELREVAAQQIVRTLSQVVIDPQTVGDNTEESVADNTESSVSDSNNEESVVDSNEEPAADTELNTESKITFEAN